MLRNRIALLTVSLFTCAALLAGCGGAPSSKVGQITIGSKDFTENIILGELVAQVIEQNTTIKVQRKLNLGGTSVNFEGIKNGDLDLYPDYDGTAYGVHLGHTEPVTDATKVYDQVKQEFESKLQLTWSKPFGFNNTYALALPKKLADQYGIKTYSDLAKYSDKFVFGTTNEFMGRKADGYDALGKAYGYHFKDVKKMTSGLRYKAMQQNEIQVMDAYATDGKLKEFDLVVLQDDKHFFPPYNGAMVIRMDTVKNNPGLLDAINKLGGVLTDQTMQEMNYRVDVKGDSVETVAHDLLKAKGLSK